MMKEKDFKNHKRNLETFSEACRKKLMTEIYEAIATYVRWYKKIKNGWSVGLNNGMEINLVNVNENIPEPVLAEDVIVIINDSAFGPVYWSNCLYKSFDSRVSMNGTMLGYKKYIKKWKPSK